MPCRRSGSPGAGPASAPASCTPTRPTITTAASSPGSRRGIKSSPKLGRHRWVVERTLAWLGQFHRLALRYERRADIRTALLTLTSAIIASAIEAVFSGAAAGPPRGVRLHLCCDLAEVSFSSPSSSTHSPASLLADRCRGTRRLGLPLMLLMRCCDQRTQVLRRPVEPRQYICIRYTERLVDATSSPPSEASTTATTTRWPNASSACSRPR